jgi:glycosyltransferase involved in cell wall biosynthesis
LGGQAGTNWFGFSLDFVGDGKSPRTTGFAGTRQVAAMKRKRLLVDVSIIVRHDAGTGIQRVVRTLGEQLALSEQSDYDVRFIRASRHLPFRYVDDVFLNGRRKFLIDRWFVWPRRGDVFLGLDLSSRILPRHARRITRWRRRGVQIAVLVYDLLPISHPDWFEKRHAEAFAKWADFVAHHCDQAICISETVRLSLVEWIASAHPEAARSLETSSLPLGGNLPVGREGGAGPNRDEQALLNRLRQCSYALVVGTLEPRKGHASLLDAFDILFKECLLDCPALVIVGRPGWKTGSLQDRIRNHPEYGRRLFWLDNAPDALVHELYHYATGVIVPTFAEGFGLPLAEAAMHSKKILARDLPVFREHDFGGVSYFKDDDAEGFADKIVDWLGRDEYDAKDRKPISWRASSDILFSMLQASEPVGRQGA